MDREARRKEVNENSSELSVHVSRRLCGDKYLFSKSIIHSDSQFLEGGLISYTLLYAFSSFSCKHSLILELVIRIVWSSFWLRSSFVLNLNLYQVLAYWETH